MKECRFRGAMAENVLLRIYTEDLKTEETRIRRECQEYPNKRFDEAIDEKLSVVGEEMPRHMRVWLNNS